MGHPQVHLWSGLAKIEEHRQECLCHSGRSKDRPLHKQDKRDDRMGHAQEKERGTGAGEETEEGKSAAREASGDRIKA